MGMDEVDRSHQSAEERNDTNAYERRETLLWDVFEARSLSRYANSFIATGSACPRVLMVPRARI